jgi:hypothetical protein
MRMRKMIMILRILNLGLKTQIHSTMCILVPLKSDAPSMMLKIHMQRILLSGGFKVALKSHSRRSSAKMTALYKFKMLRDYQ